MNIDESCLFWGVSLFLTFLKAKTEKERAERP